MGIGLLADVQRLTRQELLRLADASVTGRFLVRHAASEAPAGGHYRLPGLGARRAAGRTDRLVEAVASQCDRP